MLFLGYKEKEVSLIEPIKFELKGFPDDASEEMFNYLKLLNFKHQINHLTLAEIKNVEKKCLKYKVLTGFNLTFKWIKILFDFIEIIKNEASKKYPEVLKLSDENIRLIYFMPGYK